MISSLSLRSIISLRLFGKPYEVEGAASSKPRETETELKVSKPQKQISKFSFEPKNDFFFFFVFLP